MFILQEDGNPHEMLQRVLLRAFYDDCPRIIGCIVYDFSNILQGNVSKDTRPNRERIALDLLCIDPECRNGSQCRCA